MKSVMLFISFLIYAFPLSAQPRYEFRAVWVASVVNTDWPAAKGLPVAEQKASFIRLMDQYKSIGMNAVVVQVRPCADAFYPSTYEPWSEWLTGTQGKPPQPYYDPLQFMIEAAHERGLEFHAWINPYRAVFNINNSSVAPTHITRLHPEWFVKYGDKKYFNPGLPEVIDYVNNVVKDLISRYNMDGLHMDDYFYPYRIAGQEFPDESTYKKYGNGLAKDDWRRSNCDSIVKRIHETVLDEKPSVRFGISPFGVWRNASKDPLGSDTKAGVSNYDDLYADILLWMRNRWIDYVAPQLYWEIGHPLCDYNELTDWWARNAYDIPVYVGHGIYRTTDKPSAAWRSTTEIPKQIVRLREYPEIQGSIYFGSKNLLANHNGWADSLRNHYYHYPALIPPMLWIDSVAPFHPITKNATIQSGNEMLKIQCSPQPAETETIKLYAVYASTSLSSLQHHPVYVQDAAGASNTGLEIPLNLLSGETNLYLAITCVDTENNESSASPLIKLALQNGQWMIVN